MKLRIFRYAIFLRALTLVMGCSTVGPVVHHGQTTTPEQHREPSRSMPAAQSAATAPAQPNLMGKGPRTETTSRSVPSKKMASWDVSA